MSESSFQDSSPFLRKQKASQLNLTNNQELKERHSLYSKAPSSVTAQEDPVFTLTLSATKDSHVKVMKYTTKESKQKHSPHSRAQIPVSVRGDPLFTLTL